MQPDEDLFNPDYVEVDRVLEVAVTTDTETGEVGSSASRRSAAPSDWSGVRCLLLLLFVCLLQEVVHYLVKWCSLSYEEATWELQEDLDPEKIKEFEQIQKLPSEIRHVVGGKYRMNLSDGLTGLEPVRTSEFQMKMRPNRQKNTERL